MAGNEFKLKAVLSCVDQLSPALDNVKGKVASFNNVVSRVAKAASGLYSAVMAPLEMIGADGMFSMKDAINNFTELGDSLDKASAKAGVSVKSLQVLRTAASLGGMESEQMDKSLQKLSMTMSDAVAGKNKAAAQMFNHLGIAMKDSSGNARSAADVMRDLAEAVKNNGSQMARMQILGTIFEKEMAAGLIPVLQDGAEHFDKLTESAEKSGLLMSETDVKAAAHLTDTLSKMKGTMTKVSALIGARVAPVVDRLAASFTDLIVKNKEIIAVHVERAFNRLADFVESIDFQTIIDGLSTVIGFLFDLFDAFGGFEAVAAIFAVWMGNKCVMAVLDLGKALTSLASLLMSHPLLAVATVMVFAAIQVYKHWDRIVAWFREVFPELAGIVSAVPKAIEGAFAVARGVVKGFVDFCKAVFPEWLIDMFAGNAKMPNVSVPPTARGGNGTLTVKVEGDRNVKTQTEYQGSVQSHGGNDGFYSFFP